MDFDTRKYTICYLAALSIIAILSIISHILLNYALSRNEGFAELINVSGRQRMYSQRIASYAMQYKLGDESAKEKLKETINSFTEAHQYLLRKTRTSILSSNDRHELNSLYFQGLDSLNLLIRNYTDNAKNLLLYPPSSNVFNQSLTALLKSANSRLIKKLDHAVMLYQEESESRLVLLSTVQWLLLAVILLTLFLEALFLFRPMVARMGLYAKKFFEMATTDALTHLKSRAFFFAEANEQCRRALRTRELMSVIMIDIDDFKSINQTHGQKEGDLLLQNFSEILTTSCRDIDLISRLSGGEFVVLLPQTNIESAAEIAERLRSNVESTIIGANIIGGIQYTISAGVARVDPNNLDEALRHVESALFQAKAEGRNRVVTFKEPY